MRDLIMQVNKKSERIIYPRLTAEVKFYSRDKQFGFLKQDNKPDIYISAGELDKAKLAYVKEGDWLEFDLIPDNRPGKGGKAANIKKVEKKR